MGRAGPGVFGLSGASPGAAPRVLWAPVAVAVLVQALLFFTTVRPEIAPDSASYMAQAESLASTGLALNALGEPDTVRTPGYPLLLAAFLVTGGGYAGAIVAQRIIWILVVAATTWFAFRLARSAVVAVVAGLICALDLPALQATNSILTETLATLCVGAAVAAAYQSARAPRPAGAVLAGVLTAVAALVRPVAILLGLPLAAAVVIAGARTGRLRAAASILIVSLALSASWIARNYLETGVATFSSISNINLLLYRAAGTLAIRDPGGMDANIQRRQAELDAVACRAAEAAFARECHSVPMALRATLYPGIAMPILVAHPGATALQAARALVMIMFGGGANMLARLTGIAESTARLLAFAYTGPLALLASIGVIYWWRVDRPAVLLMLLTIAYLVLMSLGAEAYSRFRVPFLPLYAMLAGGGAAAIANRWSPDPTRP